MTQVFNRNGERVLPPTDFERRSWPEDFGQENGNYVCVCGTCGKEFMGYKRRITCKLCSVPAS